MFSSFTLRYILDEKKNKSDYSKFWQNILIGYNIDNAKHFCI